MTLPANSLNAAKPAYNTMKFGKTTIMTAQLSKAPDPYRKDNIVLKGFRDGMDHCGNGTRSRKHGVN